MADLNERARPIGVTHNGPNDITYHFSAETTGEGIVNWLQDQLNPSSPQTTSDRAKKAANDAADCPLIRTYHAEEEAMADANETTSPSYVSAGDSEHPRHTRLHWETVCDTTGWRPSLQLTVHLRGDSKADARDRLMTLCAVYDSEELLRILPTVAEARLKLTPKADPETNDMRGVTLDPQIEQLTRGMGELISAINQRHVFLLRVTDNIRTATEERFRSIEGEKIAKLNQRIGTIEARFDGWTSGMLPRCKDIEAAIEEGDGQIAALRRAVDILATTISTCLDGLIQQRNCDEQLNKSVHSLTQSTERHLHDIENEQMATLLAIEQLRPTSG